MWLYIKVVWLSGLAESVVSEKGMFDGGSQGEGALSADTGHPRHPFTTAAEFLLQL